MNLKELNTNFNNSEYLKDPEYLFIPVHRELNEALEELFVISRGLPISFIKDPNNDYREVIEYEIDGEELFNIFESERDINVRVTEVYISIVDLQYNEEDLYPYYKNRLATVIVTELYNIFNKLISLDLYKDGKLVYELYRVYHKGILMRRLYG